MKRNNRIEVFQKALNAESEIFLQMLKIMSPKINPAKPGMFAIEILLRMIAEIDPKYAKLQNLAMEAYLECEGEEKALLNEEDDDLPF